MARYKATRTAVLSAASICFSRITFNLYYGPNGYVVGKLHAL